MLRGDYKHRGIIPNYALREANSPHEPMGALLYKELTIRYEVHPSNLNSPTRGLGLSSNYPLFST
jgi:hypothetical protein